MLPPASAEWPALDADAKPLPVRERDAYAKGVVAADLEVPGDEDVIRTILADFEKHDVAITRDELVNKLNVFAAEERSQLQSS